MTCRTAVLGTCAAIFAIIAVAALHGVMNNDLTATVGIYRGMRVRKAEYARRRNIDSVALVRRNVMRPQEMVEEEFETTVEEQSPETPCEGARAALNDMASVHEQAIPANFKNTEMLEVLEQARHEIEMRYCQEEDAQASFDSEDDDASFDSDPSPEEECERYPFGTRRYVQCVIRVRGSIR